MVWWYCWDIIYWHEANFPDDGWRDLVKKNIYFKALSVFIILFLFLPFLSESVGAASSTKQRIYDDAGLLTAEEIMSLEEIANEFSIKQETDFIILTTKDAEKDITKYMEDIYDEQAFGYDKAHGNTAILTMDMKSRDVELAGFYKAKTYLDNERLGLIRKKITQDLSNENYFEAFETFIVTADEYMEYKPGVNPENIFFKWWFQIIISLGIAGLIVGTMAYNSGGRVTTNVRTYMDSNNTEILRRKDRYMRKTVTKRRKPSNNNRSGGSGGGGMTSGGHSHSGSRGKF